MKDKLTSDEYQRLSYDEKGNYTRFSGSTAVYYTLNPVTPAQPVKAVEEETIICGQTCGCKTSCNAPQPTLSETPAIESVEGNRYFT